MYQSISKVHYITFCFVYRTSKYLMLILIGFVNYFIDTFILELNKVIKNYLKFLNISFVFLDNSSIELFLCEYCDIIF